MSAGLTFADIGAEFQRRVDRTVWCSFVTVDAQGRPRARLLHPIWQGQVGWVLTGRSSHKARELDGNPYASLTYWDQTNEQVHAECRTRWIDEPADRRRLWQLFKDTPFPLGYDPGLFFETPEDPEFGVLRLEPWRVELWSLADLMSGKSPQVWRA